MLDLLEPGQLDPRVDLFDFNANFQRLRHSVDRSELKTAIKVPNGNTDPDALAGFARAIADNSTMSAELAGYDCVAIKSCYSSSAIKTDEQLANFQSGTLELVGRLKQINPRVKIVLITPPPRRRWLTSIPDSQRAAQFCSWMLSLKQSSVDVIDLHSKLSENGVLARRFCRLAPYDQHPNAAGSRAGLELICRRINELN